MLNFGALNVLNVVVVGNAIVRCVMTCKDQQFFKLFPASLINLCAMFINTMTIRRRRLERTTH